MIRRTVARRCLPALACATALAVAACSGSDHEDEGTPATTPDPAPTTAAPTTTAAPVTSTAAPTTTVAPTTTAAPDPTVILLTNDDGIGAEGIDTVARVLLTLPGVELVIVAPAENQSGSSDTTSAAPPASAPATTTSGLEGIAVSGTPADSVIHALDTMGIEPDLVVSGANAGHNIGPFVPISGTVGAARVAARREIPAIAVSAGFPAEHDFESAAAAALAEVEAFLADPSRAANPDQVVVNLNSPTCPVGAPRAVLDVVTAAGFPEGIDAINLPYDCQSAVTAPATDVEAMINGFVARTIVPADL